MLWTLSIFKNFASWSKKNYFLVPKNKMLLDQDLKKKILIKRENYFWTKINLHSVKFYESEIIKLAIIS